MRLLAYALEYGACRLLLATAALRTYCHELEDHHAAAHLAAAVHWLAYEGCPGGERCRAERAAGVMRELRRADEAARLRVN